MISKWNGILYKFYILFFVSVSVIQKKAAITDCIITHYGIKK